MMHRYEALILSVPTITKDEIVALEQQVSGLAEKHKISLLSFDRWGKYRLAYPVGKNEYGVYFLTRFESEGPQSFLDDVKKLFTLKLNDIVMRYLINKLDIKQSLEYERPQSLEETPESEGSDDLNKAKIERILTRADDSKAQRNTTEQSEEPQESLSEEEAEAPIDEVSVEAQEDNE